VDATYLEIYQEKIMDLLNPHATSGGGPLKPKDRLKMEAKRKKLMADKGNPKAAEEAREILRQLAPSYQGDKGPKVILCKRKHHCGIKIDGQKIISALLTVPPMVLCSNYS
jgi:hypothetical protein